MVLRKRENCFVVFFGAAGYRGVVEIEVGVTRGGGGRVGRILGLG